MRKAGRSFPGVIASLGSMKGPVPDENLREGFPDDVIGIRGSLLKAE
jgi:hypothetical protein